MTHEFECKNYAHSKEDHKLLVEYTGGPKVLPGTIMHDAHLESEIRCTLCSCTNYSPKEP